MLIKIEKFKKLGYDFELLSLPHETATGLTMSDNIKSVNAWNVYPTYDQYVAMHSLGFFRRIIRISVN